MNTESKIYSDQCNSVEQANFEPVHSYQTIPAKKVELPDNYQFFFLHPIKRFFSKILVIIAYLVFMPYARIAGGFRIYGKKNKAIAKDGAIFIANHCFPLDAFYIIISNKTRRLNVLSLQSNLGWPFLAGKYIRGAGAVPIPEKREQLRSFNRQLLTAMEQKQSLLVYPEASLELFCDHIRPFKKGAFRFAIQCEKPLIPMVWTFHKPRGLRRLIRRKPVVHLHVLEPYYVEKMATSHETLEKAMVEVHKIMNDFFQANNEVFLEEPTL